MNESLVEGVMDLERGQHTSRKRDSADETVRHKTMHYDPRSKSKKKIDKSLSNKTFEVHNHTATGRVLTQVTEDEEKADEIDKLRDKVRHL
jgi:hypothetical protein